MLQNQTKRVQDIANQQNRKKLKRTYTTPTSTILASKNRYKIQFMKTTKTPEIFVHINFLKTATSKKTSSKEKQHGIMNLLSPHLSCK